MKNKLSKSETKECEECAGRGWIGGASRGRDSDGTAFTDVTAYKMTCPNCAGTGRTKTA
jgi:DnaJ-class molecular chaperone